MAWRRMIGTAPRERQNREHLTDGTRIYGQVAMITKLIAIASNTFLETIRQPIYGIMLIVTCIMMLLNVSLAAYTLSDDNIFLRSLGLSTLLLSGLFLASFSAAGVLSREIENKTIMTILSKPVSRPVLIAGKFIGLITALTTAFYICTLAMMFVVRHGVMMNTTDPYDLPAIIFGFAPIVLALGISAYGNFMYGWQFSSTSVFLLTPLMTLGYFLVMIIDSEWKLQVPYLGEANLIGAIILVLLLVWIISAIALTVSCKVGQVATLTICVIVLMIGLTSDYVFGQQHLEGIGLIDQPSMIAKLAWIAYRVIPNLGVFWVADAIAMGKNLGPAYMFSAFGYAALYIVAILMLGIAVFQKREVG